jgi:hypothetical protein
MKIITRFILIAAFASLFTGCISHNTYSVANVPIVPSEVAKSKLLGENCAKVVLGIFGPFGDTSIKGILDNNRNSKVTLVDYKLSNYVVMYEICSEVYGY